MTPLNSYPPLWVELISFGFNLTFQDGIAGEQDPRTWAQRPASHKQTLEEALEPTVM